MDPNGKDIQLKPAGKDKFLNSLLGWIYLKLVAIAGALTFCIAFYWLIRVILWLLSWPTVRLFDYLRDQLVDRILLGVPFYILCFVGGWMIVIVTLVAVLDHTRKAKSKVLRDQAGERDNARISSPSPKSVATDEIVYLSRSTTSKRKIVICIDGTNDFAATTPTHVYRLYSNLPSNENQLTYYDGGVGSLGDTSKLSIPGRAFATAWDLAFANSLRRNVLSAYQFLMENYRGKDLDEVYLFGFSRGAYACRVLAGLLNVFGVLPKGLDNLVPYVWQSFAKLSTQWDGDSVRLMKCSMRIHRVPIEYIGVWDTVSSVGFLRQQTFPYTRSLLNVVRGCHAISIDEKRNMFPENPTSNPNVEEIWFAGNHRGVGGGDKNSRKLSFIPYNWVVEGVIGKLDIIDNKCEFDGAQPKEAGVTEKPVNDFLTTAVYFFMGLFPQRIYTESDIPNKSGYRWHWFRFWHVRVPKNANIHSTVLDRIAEHKGAYFPKNVFGDSWTNPVLKNGNTIPPNPPVIIKP